MHSYEYVEKISAINMVKLPVIPLDKQAHFLTGYAIAITLGIISPMLGVVIAAIIGWLKEEYDKRRPDKHTADIFDFYFTVFGGITGTVIVVIMTWISKSFIF